MAGNRRPSTVISAASMRPRRIRRGWPWDDKGGRWRFNEAPPPGMAGPGPETQATKRTASMRPRRIRRGWAERRVEMRQNEGTGFNEASANSPGMAPSRYSRFSLGRAVASMRPRRIRRGWLARRSKRRDPADNVASMRPRRIRRGWAFARDSALADTTLASMRPRRIRRGWRRPGEDPARQGPRFNEAPANSPGMERFQNFFYLGPGVASMRPRRIRRGWPGRGA